MKSLFGCLHYIGISSLDQLPYTYVPHKNVKTMTAFIPDSNQSTEVFEISLLSVEEGVIVQYKFSFANSR